MKLVSAAFLVFAAAAEAQSVNWQDCLADKLLSIQPDSIIVNFNQKIIRILVTPETEIWRRGVDLKSTAELIIGDNIYVRCTKTPAPDGTPIADVVAAVQEGSGVDLKPHDIREIRGCGGHLIDVAAASLVIANDKGTCTLRIAPATDIWRGETYHDASALRIGDEVGSRAFVSYPSGELIADLVEANVAKTEGKIVSVKPDRIVVKEDRFGRVTVFIDNRTKCDECATTDLRKGAIVLATGLELTKNSFRASYITVEH
jgi:hypothetical protein